METWPSNTFPFLLGHYHSKTRAINMELPPFNSLHASMKTSNVYLWECVPNSAQKKNLSGQVQLMLEEKTWFLFNRKLFRRVESGLCLGDSSSSVITHWTTSLWTWLYVPELRGFHILLAILGTKINHPSIIMFLSDNTMLEFLEIWNGLFLLPTKAQYDTSIRDKVKVELQMKSQKKK